ncbi:(Fe-S)-binding protein [Chloroflexota bacterium]
METVSLFREGVDALQDAGGKDVKLCFQCALCTVTCPWNSVRNFQLRRMIRQGQFGLVELKGDDWWLCVTCGLCTSRCPRGVPIIEIMRSVRRIMVGAGMAPESLRSVSASLGSLGNPWGQDREKRTDWTDGLDVKLFVKGMELLYFPCCTAQYDPVANRIARSTVRVLQEAGVDFGVLGTAEVCCGESIRKAGNESLFQSLAQSNIAAFVDAGVTKILTSSPHCFYTFNKEYAELGGQFEVVHFTQYLWELLSQERLGFSRKLETNAVYHDPCYLGRHCNIYEEPRKILESIPGVKLLELKDSRETSLCCGGGGGRIWMETLKRERFADTRLAQAQDVGAQVLVTACPYCMLNFEASFSGDEDRPVEIKDLSELVAEAL